MNSKLLKIKELLSSIITTEFQKLSTDKGLLEITKIEVGAVVRLVDEDGKETEAEDGVYESEDCTLTIENGKVVELVDKKADNTPIEKEEEQPETEVSVTEETVTTEETVDTEDITEESSSSEETESQSDSEQSETETEVEKRVEEEIPVVIEETVDPADTDAENLADAVEELAKARVRIAELEAKVKELEEALAKPATNEFKQIIGDSTRYSKIDKMKSFVRGK